MKKKIIIGSSIGALLLAGGIAIAAPGIIDSNTGITRADFIANADARFTARDFDKDGKLTTADRTAADSARADARFALLDADKNGQITRAEFDAAEAKRAEMRGDRDGDGDRGHRGKRGGHGKGDRGGRGGGFGFGGGGLQMADANKDGVVTLQEYRAQANAVFTKMDANKDGSVTRAERKAVRDAERAARETQRDIEGE